MEELVLILEDCSEKLNIIIFTNSVQEFHFLHILADACYILFFDNNHPERGEVISHCGFDLHFLW